MRKIMTLMLGLSLVLGSNALFAKGAKDTTKKEKKAKKTHKTKTKKTGTHPPVGGFMRDRLSWKALA